MPIPDSTGQDHDSVVESGRFVAVHLRDASQTLGSADGVFDLDPLARMGLIVGALDSHQGGVRVLFTTPGLAVGHALGTYVAIGEQAQVAQIGQYLPQVGQARMHVKLVFEHLVIMPRAAGGGSQVVPVAVWGGNERIFTGDPFFYPRSRRSELLVLLFLFYLVDPQKVLKRATINSCDV